MTLRNQHALIKAIHNEVGNVNEDVTEDRLIRRPSANFDSNGSGTTLVQQINRRKFVGDNIITSSMLVIGSPGFKPVSSLYAS